MQFVQDTGEGFEIKAYDAESIQVDETTYYCSLIISADAVIEVQNLRMHTDIDITLSDQFDPAKTELILIGTGDRHEFLAPQLHSEFLGKGFVIEVMTTAAACRTYNVLMSEGRKVAAILIINS